MSTTFHPLVWILSFFLSVPVFADLHSETAADLRTVEKILQDMTIEEKLGQMFMLGFEKESVTADKDLRHLLREYKIGNIILFERNIRGMRPWQQGYSPTDVPKNVVALTNSLQDAVPALKRRPSVSIPLFIAVDQEGGSQLRIEKGVTVLPGAISLGQTRSLDLARQAGLIVGQELRAMGITMNLAPVMDVDANTGKDIINDRAFGGHPDIVTPLGIAFMNGLHEGGVVAVAKHFPGHGDSRADPHEELPRVRRSRSFLEKINIPPFQAIINAGVTALMPAHIYFENLSSQKGMPFSLDPILKTLLRDKLNFRGVIIGDDLTGMRAVVNETRSIEDAIKLSIDAGTDIVMLAHSSKPLAKESFPKVFGELVERFQENPDRLDDSVRRILALKMRIRADLDARKWKTNPEDLGKAVQTPQHVSQAKRIARASVVLLSEKGALVSHLKDTQYFSRENYPLKRFKPNERLLVVSPVFSPPDVLLEAVKDKNRHDVDSVRLLYGWKDVEANRPLVLKIWDQMLLTNWKEQVPRIMAKAGDAKAIIFGVTWPDHARILKEVVLKLKGKGKPIFVLCFRQPDMLPREVLEHEDVSVISVGSSLNLSMQAAVDVLYGLTQPKTSEYITVSVLPEEWINRGAELGAAVKGWSPPPLPVPNPVNGRQAAVWLYLWSYLAGLLGATVSVVTAGRLPRSLFWEEDTRGSPSPGWIPLIMAQASFGTLLFGIVRLIDGLQLSSQFPDLGVVEELAMDSYAVALFSGFVGGVVGRSVLKIVPILRRAF